MKEKSFTHLTVKERRLIEKWLSMGRTKTVIAGQIGKDKSTISKEVKNHLIVIPAKEEHDCIEYKWCRGKRHHNGCDGCHRLSPFQCRQRDHSPGVCNGCGNLKHCEHERHIYDADRAQEKYETELVSKRQGLDITSEEFKKQKDIIVPLLKQGQSPYAIVTANPDVTICEKTIYNWIHEGYFAKDGFIDIDLRRKVGRKMTKGKKLQYKKRKDHQYLKGRTFKDYQAYMDAHPDSNVMFMDTVYNKQSGPFIQTMKFKPIGLFFALYHEEKTAEEMYEGLLSLERCLGPALFEKYAGVIVTDRGSEFTLADKIERRPDGSQRCHIFYCDPMASGQKGSLEQMHTVLRFFLPKKKDLQSLGLTSQDALSLIVSHMDSYPYKALKGKTPVQMADFFWPDLMERMEAFGIKRISPRDVTLKPYILKTVAKVVDEGATLEDLERDQEASDPGNPDGAP